jgi:SSS family solute:Na+ symporter
MIYIVVIAAVWLIPVKLGGYAHVFEVADAHFKAKGGATGILLKPTQFTAFASLALGSALAAFMYPHTMTAVLSSASEKTVRKNAIFLPAYTLLLGLIALLGYMAIAADVNVKSASDVVPALFGTLFPAWFIGFAAAAIAISALVPAAIMSIGAANLFTRNLWRPLVSPNITPQAEASTAKIVSLVVKFGALLFIVFLPTQYAIDLQLLGGYRVLVVHAPSEYAGPVPRLAGGDRDRLRAGHVAGPQAGVCAASRRLGLSAVYRPDCAGGQYRGDVCRVGRVAAQDGGSGLSVA